MLKELAISFAISVLVLAVFAIIILLILYYPWYSIPTFGFIIIWAGIHDSMF